jgi:hypothetical protein
MVSLEIKDWNRLVEEAFDEYEAETNFKYPFEVLTRRYGKAYIEYSKAAYIAKDSLSDEEFCRLNHCPINFLNKIK